MIPYYMTSIDEIVIVGTTYYKSKKNSITANHLSKTWKISQEDTQLTIDNIAQRCGRQADPSVKRKYSANDRILRCERLDDCFYVETFHANKSKSIKSLR